MKRHSKLIRLAALCASALVTLTACGTQTQNPSESEAQQSSGTGFPFTLTTYNDAKVEFTKVPERVIAANPNAGEELMALGLGDYIIATSYNNAEVAEEYREEYESKQSLTEEGQPSLEVVLSLNPDFIYGRSSAFGENGIASHDTLSQNGIMSLSSIESYKLGADVEDVYQDFYNLGKIFNVEDRAEALVSDMKTRIEAVEQIVSEAEPITVFNFDMEVDGGAYTPGNNFTSKLIRRAGGINVFEDLENTWNTVSWEAVVEADPDFIIINDYAGTPIEEKIAQLTNNPALAGLDAIKEERFLVITLPEVFASARIADTIEKFAEAFHPELFTE